jgi:hypothetical protein
MLKAILISYGKKRVSGGNATHEVSRQGKHVNRKGLTTGGSKVAEPLQGV